LPPRMTPGWRCAFCREPSWLSPTTWPACRPVCSVGKPRHQPPNGHLPASQQGQAGRASRRARVCRRAHRAADLAVRRSDRNGSAIAGAAEDRGRGARTGTRQLRRLIRPFGARKKAGRLRVAGAFLAEIEARLRRRMPIRLDFVVTWSRNVWKIASAPNGRDRPLATPR